MNILTELKARFRVVLAELVDDPTELLGMIRVAQDAKFGDYQANGLARFSHIKDN